MIFKAFLNFLYVKLAIFNESIKYYIIVVGKIKTSVLIFCMVRRSKCLEIDLVMLLKI